MENEQNTGLDRRAFIKRAGVVGGVIWAAPAVQSMTSSAYATGSPPPPGGCANISYVIVWITSPNGNYRLKFEGKGADGYVLESCGGPSQDDTGCQKAFDALNTAFPNATCDGLGSIGFTSGSDGSLNLVLPAGYSVGGWLIHDGALAQCNERGRKCVASPNGTLSTVLCDGWSAGTSFVKPGGCDDS